MKIKFTLVDLSILFAIASTSLYIVFRNIPFIGVDTFIAWAAIALVIIISKSHSFFWRSEIMNLLFFGALMLGALQYTLWKPMNDWNRIHILLEFYYLVVFTAIFLYYRSRSDFVKLAWLSKWAFIFVIISLVGTNVALYLDPMLVRQAASTGDFTSFQGRLYKVTGAMGYSYIQAIVCLIPILVYHIKNKKKMVFGPKALIGILLIIIITEIRAQVFANILVTAVITLLSLIGFKKRRKSFIVISLLGILVLAIPNNFYEDFFYTLSTYFDPDSVIYSKLKDFSVFIGSPELDTSTGAGKRANRYQLLFEALLDTPIVGIASYKNMLDDYGVAHLYWMNRLALWGIPGFLFFVYVLYKIFRSISSLFDIDFRFYYLLSVTALVLLGLTKVIVSREPWLLLIVIIPGLYFLPLLDQAKSIKDEKTYC